MALVYDSGLALHLYPAELLRFGAVHTAADDAVRAETYFLCLSADAREGLWTPLQATRGKDRLPIPEDAKTGQARWTRGVSYYSLTELWRIPHKAIQRAAQAAGDRSAPNATNRVAAKWVPDPARFAVPTPAA
jgi:hypothetical protein